MFDSDILKPDNLRSQTEDRNLLYSGWEILTYTRLDNQEPLKEKIRNRFSGDGWTFCEHNHRFFVSYVSFDSEVEIIFKEIEYSDERAKNTEKYRATFQSPFFGFKDRAEKNHRKLCRMVLSRIRWKKRGFWIKEGNRFLIPEYRRLKLKRR